MRAKSGLSFKLISKLKVAAKIFMLLRIFVLENSGLFCILSDLRSGEKWRHQGVAARLTAYSDMPPVRHPI